MSAENHRKLAKFHGLTATLVGTFLTALCSVGCSLVAQEQPSTATSTTVLLPWVSGGSYHFERVVLNSLISVPNLQGDAATFLLSPSVANAKLVGFQPRVRTFIDAEGAHVPTDDSSVQLLTLYAHLEKLDDMDRALGLGLLLPRPRIVGVEVRIPNDQTSRGQVENNALYSPKLDALLFVPYKGNDLPLAVNAGVIAHEHFHALFNYLVLQLVKQKIKSVAAHVHPEDEAHMEKTFTDLKDKIAEKITVPNADSEASEWESYHENLLRGINEGLADVWGWIYTGDPVFVRRSLPILERTRDLDVHGIKIQSRDRFRVDTRINVQMGSQSNIAYGLGTQYARVLKSVFEADFKTRGVDRIELSKTILKVLPKLATRLNALGTGEWMAPAELMDMFATEVAADRPEVCAQLLSFVADISSKGIATKCGVDAAKIVDTVDAAAGDLDTPVETDDRNIDTNEVPL